MAVKCHLHWPASIENVISRVTGGSSVHKRPPLNDSGANFYSQSRWDFFGPGAARRPGIFREHGGLARVPGMESLEASLEGANALASRPLRSSVSR
jgi:hypothetical protein